MSFDRFASRHIGPDAAQLKEMLDVIGVESREEHGARIERAREIDDFVYGFCRHGEMLANPARPRQKSRR